MITKWFMASLKASLKEVLCRFFDWPFFCGPPFQGMKARAYNRLFGARLAPDCILMTGVRAINWRNVRMDAGTYIANDVDLRSHGPIRIGQWSMVGSETMMASGGHTTTDLAVRSSPIVIGKGVFVGVRVVILEGVTIGDHAMIGAAADVTRDIPPLAIAVGCPAKVIGYRRKPDRIWSVNGMIDLPRELSKTEPPELACVSHHDAA